MTKHQYERKCKELFEKAESLGAELDFSPEQFEPRKLNCLWYGGWYASIQIRDDLDIGISVTGDVRAALLDKNGNEIASVRDKNNSGAFSEYMREHIRDDKHLKKLLSAGDLVLENNNWIEYDGVYYPNGRSGLGVTVDLGTKTDNIVDNDILNAIDNVLDDLEEIKSVILSCIG